MENKLLMLGRVVFTLSFIIGTTLFVLFFNNEESDQIIQIGFIFVISALIVNSVLFIVILIFALKNHEYRERLFITAGIMLINIPIVTIYLYALFTTFLGF